MSEPSQLSFNLDFRPAYGRDDFFVGPANEEAISNIDKWPDWGVSPFLVIYGEEGSGKKHIASVWQSKSNAVVLDAKSFPEADIQKILDDTPNIILHQLHLLLGDRDQEEKLFHIYNKYITLPEKSHVLMTSRMAPSRDEIVIPDLRSRIMGSQIVRIRNPDDMMLLQVLGKQLTDKGFQPSEDLLLYAVNLMERSWTMPKRLAEMLHRISLDQKSKLSKKMIRDAILHIENSAEFQRQQEMFGKEEKTVFA